MGGERGWVAAMAGGCRRVRVLVGSALFGVLGVLVAAVVAAPAGVVTEFVVTAGSVPL